MLRGVYLIIAILFTISIAIHQKSFVINAIQQDQQQQQHKHAKEEQLHPSLLVDTKFWLGNTELGERENWLNDKKPCTLQEQIRLDEQSAISLSDYMDSLGGAIQADIKDLALPTNGLILFEESTLGDTNDPVDPAFIQYLNQSGECLESSDMREAGFDDKAPHFNFRPTSDQMSWFNPYNWASTLNGNEIKDWIPESHQIPCSEDVVVFGSREVALRATVEANERSSVLSFKVNFEPSQWASPDVVGDSSVNHIRVSKLRIGNLSYSQHEFEQLINSEQYENILFQFNSNRSVLRAEEGFAYPAHSLLTIDESSIQLDTSYDLCLDEAGCMCGNENTNVMKIICSFRDLIEPDDHPCHDPIPSAGYCNKICATVITIGMDPTRFSEKFVSNTIYKMLSDGEMSNYFADSVFTGARRTHDNKYEITFRYVPTGETESGGANLNYATNMGKEQEFAKLVYEQLNNEATKSFYGIKSISIRSSVDWRKSNRGSIFWISYIMLSLVSIAIFVAQDHLGDGGASAHQTCAGQTGPNWWFDQTLRSLNALMGGRDGLMDSSDESTDSFVTHTDPSAMGDLCNQTTNVTAPEIPLVNLDSETWSE